MTEKARGVILMGLVLCVTPGPALTADSSAAPNANTVDAANRPPDAIMFEPYAPDATLYAPMDFLTYEKRSQMGFHGMRGKKDFDWEKRNVLGFHGMRGKKWLDEELEKRAPMAFQGMRGKKWMDDEEMLKRAQMGFQGMRGKKDEADKRAQMGFQGMRGKKLSADENLESVVLDPIIEDVEKRAPMMAFQGMRGKKDEFEKRAQMGFYGMRGKKDNEFTLEQDDDIEAEKRAMAFHGMRGKKQNDFALKRAMGFLGMRGKKRLQDMRTPQFYQNNGNGELGNLMEYLNEANDGSNVAVTSSTRSRRAAPIRSSKKARNAFFGMRGKKTVHLDAGSSD